MAATLTSLELASAQIQQSKGTLLPLRGSIECRTGPLPLYCVLPRLIATPAGPANHHPQVRSVDGQSALPVAGCLRVH